MHTNVHTYTGTAFVQNINVGLAQAHPKYSVNCANQDGCTPGQNRAVKSLQSYTRGHCAILLLHKRL